jgi:hypothetical protein
VGRRRKFTRLRHLLRQVVPAAYNDLRGARKDPRLRDVAHEVFRCGAQNSDATADMPPARRGLKSGTYDPDVWSGRAVQTLSRAVKTTEIPQCGRAACHPLRGAILRRAQEGLTAPRFKTTRSPAVKRVAVIFNPATPPYAGLFWQPIEAAAPNPISRPARSRPLCSPTLREATGQSKTTCTEPST